MKQILYIVLVTVAFLPACGQSSSNMSVEQKHFYAQNKIAIHGYDPVSYFKDGPLKGNDQFTVEIKGIKYIFANDENKKEFVADPAKYLPAYGGWCAYAMGDTGEKVKIDPETYKITNGRLFLFYNFRGYNTLEDWNKNEKELTQRADNFWSTLLKY